MLQTVNYVSDAEGFKVAATNLPQAPVAESLAKPVAVVAPTVKVAEPTIPVQEERQEKQILLDEEGKIRPETVPVAFNTHIFDNIGVIAPGVVAPATVPAYTVEKHDDMEVIGETKESIINTPTYDGTPLHYYAPQQGYYQPPVTPAVVQTPVQAPVAYYAPYHGYQPLAEPNIVPVTYQTAPVAPVSAPVSGHSQFHAQVNTSNQIIFRLPPYLENYHFTFRMS